MKLVNKLIAFISLICYVNFVNCGFSDTLVTSNNESNSADLTLQIFNGLWGNYSKLTSLMANEYSQSGNMQISYQDKLFLFKLDFKISQNNFQVNVSADKQYPEFNDLPKILEYKNGLFSNLSKDNVIANAIFAKLAYLIKAQFILSTVVNNKANLLYLGDSKHNNQPVFLIKEQVNNNDNVTLIVNQQNYLVEEIIFSESGSETNVVELSDYKKNGQIYFPYEAISINKDYQIDYKIISNDGLLKPESLIVPFKFRDNEIIIDCELGNNTKVKAIFSSAFKNSVIDTKFAYANNLMKITNQNQNNFVISKIQIDKLKIDNLNLANFTFQLANLDNLIKSNDVNIVFGLDIFTNARIAIDYSKQTISFNLDNPNTTVNVWPWSNTLPIIEANLPVKNSSTTMKLLLDTGAKFNYLKYTIAPLADVTNIYSSKILALDLNNQPKQMTILNFKNVRIGDLLLPLVGFRYPCQNTAVAMANDEYSGILSNQFLKDYILVLDQTNHCISLIKNETSQSPFAKLINQGNEALLYQRNYRLSESLYQEALIKAGKNNHNNIIAIERLGNLRRIMGHDLNRREHYKTSYILLSKALSLAKFYKDEDLTGLIYSDLAVLYAYDGQSDNVLPLVVASLKSSCDNVNVLVNASLCEIKLNKIVEARENLNKALFIDPSNWQALWFLFKIAQIKNDKAFEKLILNTIIFFYPWSKLAKKLLDK